MEKYSNTATDTAGTVLSGVSIRVKNAGTAVDASLFSDDGSTVLANPFTNNTDGTYYFYAANGRYDITLTKAGYTFNANATSDITLFDNTDATTTTQTAINYTYNADMEVWGSGTASAPTGWTLNGAGASCAKNTTAGQFKLGAASAALTRAGTDCYLAQSPDTFQNYGPVAWWQGKVVRFGCWVRATVANRARLAINDGVGTTNSSYHTGGSTFEFLSVQRTIDNAATKVEVRLVVDTGNTTAQFDGATLVVDSSLTDYIPSSWRGRKSLMMTTTTNTQAVNLTRFYMANGPDATEVNVLAILPITRGVIRKLTGHLDTAPTGTSTATESVTLTLRKSFADTSLVATISGANTNAVDVTNEVSFTATEPISVKAVTSTGSATVRVKATFEVEEIP